MKYINYKKEIIIRSIKILDIGYITAVYFILGLILGRLCDKQLGKFNKKKADEKSIFQNIFELILYLWFIGVVIYIVKNLFEMVPFPFEGVYGFKHLKVNDLTNATIFSISFIFFQEHYQSKITYIFSKINM